MKLPNIFLNSNMKSFGVMYWLLTISLFFANVMMMKKLITLNLLWETTPEMCSQAGHNDRISVQLTSVDMFEDLGSRKINATDPRLLKYLRDKWIFAPSSRPYDLENPEKEHMSQIGQSQVVDRLLKQRKNGFFVEAGASNGEKFSNSLFFERFRNWNGVLVEANPLSFHTLSKKHRKAFSINSCLSLSPHPDRVEFTMASSLGGITQETYTIPSSEQSLISGRSLVQCFSIHSILGALCVNHVDYFSLDVEGAEVEILRTFPWKDITVDIWSIEYAVHGGGKDTPKRLLAIRDIFQKTGAYEEIGLEKRQDVLFARKEIL